MEIVEVNLTEYEKSLAESYAQRHGLSLEEAFKKALFNKIEEELSADPFYSKENMEELERRVNAIRSEKSTLKEHELIEELSDDPFYSEENMERLERAAADAKAGRNMEEHELVDE